MSIGAKTAAMLANYARSLQMIQMINPKKN
jgi:hypothetical protein